MFAGRLPARTITQYVALPIQFVVSVGSTVMLSGCQNELEELVKLLMLQEVLLKEAGSVRARNRSAVDPGSMVSSTVKAYGRLLLKLNQWQRPAPRLAENCCGR